MNQLDFDIHLSEINPPSEFCDMILSRIAGVRRRQARLRLLLESSICFALGVLLVPLAQYAGAEFYASGFYEYASLLYSDRGVVLNSWQEFLLSLVESLPSVALLLLLTVTVALVWSIRRAIHSGRLAFMPLGHTTA